MENRFSSTGDLSANVNISASESAALSAATSRSRAEAGAPGIQSFFPEGATAVPQPVASRKCHIRPTAEAQQQLLEKEKSVVAYVRQIGSNSESAESAIQQQQQSFEAAATVPSERLCKGVSLRVRGLVQQVRKVLCESKPLQQHQVGASDGRWSLRSRRKGAARAREAASFTPERLEEILAADSHRDCNADYPIPKWLQRQGVTCPFRYHQAFHASYGIINYDLKGKPGDPLVVTFHGLNGTQLTFLDFQTVLTRFGYRTLIFDLYGHGLSAAPRYSFFLKRYGLKFFVKQTEELLAHVGLLNERMTLVGFSMGCVIAAQFALVHADTVEKVCLIAPAGMLPSKPVSVKILEHCGWCFSPFCCLVPFCMCRCCISKEAFIDRYEKDDYSEHIGAPPPSEAPPPAAGAATGAASARSSSSRTSNKSTGNNTTAISQSTTKAAAAPIPAAAAACCSSPASGSERERSFRWKTGSLFSGEKWKRRSGLRVKNDKSSQRTKTASSPPVVAPAAPAAAAEGETANSQQQQQPQDFENVRAGELLWRRLMWQLYVKKGVVATFFGCVTHVPLWDAKKIFEQLGATEKPVLLLWGAEDTVAPQTCAVALQNLLPNSELIIFPRTSHLVLADRPDACIGCVMAFLDFAPQCDMRRWHYLLPFSSHGLYVPPSRRTPPHLSREEYLEELHYKPRYSIRLPSNQPIVVVARPSPPSAASQPVLPPSSSSSSSFCTCAPCPACVSSGELCHSCCSQKDIQTEQKKEPLLQLQNFSSSQLPPTFHQTLTSSSLSTQKNHHKHHHHHCHHAQNIHHNHSCQAHYHQAAANSSKTFLKPAPEKKGALHKQYKSKQQFIPKQQITPKQQFTLEQQITPRQQFTLEEQVRLEHIRTKQITSKQEGAPGVVEGALRSRAGAGERERGRKSGDLDFDVEIDDNEDDDGSSSSSSSSSSSGGGGGGEKRASVANLTTIKTTTTGWEVAAAKHVTRKMGELLFPEEELLSRGRSRSSSRGSQGSLGPCCSCSDASFQLLVDKAQQPPAAPGDETAAISPIFPEDTDPEEDAEGSNCLTSCGNCVSSDMRSVRAAGGEEFSLVKIEQHEAARPVSQAAVSAATPTDPSCAAVAAKPEAQTPVVEAPSFSVSSSFQQMQCNNSPRQGAKAAASLAHGGSDSPLQLLLQRKMCLQDREVLGGEETVMPSQCESASATHTTTTSTTFTAARRDHARATDSSQTTTLETTTTTQGQFPLLPRPTESRRNEFGVCIDLCSSEDQAFSATQHSKKTTVDSRSSSPPDNFLL